MASFSSGSSSFSDASAASVPSLPSRDAAAVVPFLWEEKPGVSKQFSTAHKPPTPPRPQLVQLVVGEVGVLPLPRPPGLQGTMGSVSSEQRRRVLESLWGKKHARKEEDPFWVAIEVCKEESKDGERVGSEKYQHKKKQKKNIGRSSASSSQSFSSTSSSSSSSVGRRKYLGCGTIESSDSIIRYHQPLAL